MGAESLFGRFVDALGAVITDLRRMARGSRILLVRLESGELVARVYERSRKRPQQKPLSSRSIRRVGRHSIVRACVSPDELVHRTISVPAAARGFLDGVIANQIERISPWQLDEASFAYDLRDAKASQGGLEVDVFVTSKNAIDLLRKRLGDLKVRVDEIVVDREGTNKPPLRLWSPSGPRHLRRAGVLAATAVSAAFLGLLVIAGLNIRSSVRIAGMADEADASAASMRRGLQSAPKALGSTDSPAERAWAEKGSIPPAVYVVEALTDALPDSAYVTELRISEKSLRISGLAADPPAIIPALEKAGTFANVGFYGPSTRAPDGVRFRYYIEATVTPAIWGAQPVAADQR